MATKTVEVDRKSLSTSDAKELQELMASLDSLRAQYGQHQFNLDYLRAQYENAVQQTVEDGDSLRKGIQEAQTAVQERSQELLTSYDIDTSGGGWSLDTTMGAFVQYREEEVKPKRRARSAKPRKSRKNGKATKTKRAPRRAAKKSA